MKYKTIDSYRSKRLRFNELERLINDIEAMLPLAGNINQDPCNQGGSFHIEGGHYDANNNLIMVYCVSIHEAIAMNTLSVCIYFMSPELEELKVEPQYNWGVSYSSSVTSLVNDIKKKIGSHPVFKNDFKPRRKKNGK